MPSSAWKRKRRESALHLEVEALCWAMESMLQYSTCQKFGTDCKDLITMIEDPKVWICFSTELERLETPLFPYTTLFRSGIGPDTDSAPNPVALVVGR